MNAELVLRVPDREGWPFTLLPERPRSAWQAFWHQFPQSEIEDLVNNWLAEHRSALRFTKEEYGRLAKSCGKSLDDSQFGSLFVKLLGFCECIGNFTEVEESASELKSFSTSCGRFSAGSRLTLDLLSLRTSALYAQLRNAVTGREFEEAFALQYFLEKVALAYGVKEADIQLMLSRRRDEAMREFLTPLLDKNKWVPEIDAAITAYAKAIGAHPDSVVPSDLAAKIRRLKVIWILETSAEMPTIQCDVLLGKGEVCHWRSEAVWLEEAAIAQGRSYVGIGTSVRLISGMSLHAGYFQPTRHAIHALKIVTSGHLYVTSKRLILVGLDARSKTVTWRTVLDIWPTEDGFMVVKSSGKSPVLKIVFEPEITLRMVIAAAKHSAQ